MHLDYAPTAPAPFSDATPRNTTSGNNQPKKITRPYSEPFLIEKYVELILLFYSDFNYYHIIRVRGTPATGKTTVIDLVVNHLFENHGKERPIYVLTGWGDNSVRRKGGWGAYLEQETGVHGNQWLTHSAYLVIDEAQESYWDGALWADLFKRIERGVSPYILLFTPYGSPDRSFVGFSQEKHTKVPLIIRAEKQISLRADEGVASYNPSRAHLLTLVGLLLDKNEAMDVVTLIIEQMQPRPSLTEDVKEGLVLFSGGHIGLLISLLGALDGVPDIRGILRKNRTLDWQTAAKILFGRPWVFFRHLSNQPFARGMSRPDETQSNDAIRVFKKVILCHGILKSEAQNEDPELKQALEDICRNGWLH